MANLVALVQAQTSHPDMGQKDANVVIIFNYLQNARGEGSSSSSSKLLSYEAGALAYESKHQVKLIYRQKQMYKNFVSIYLKIFF